METTAQKTPADEVRDYIRHTIGTENHYKSPFHCLRWTDGVQFVADTCGAHWLIDLIASHQAAILRKEKRHPISGADFQVWELTKEPDGRYAARCWSDTPRESTRLATQIFDYSDFPEELMPFKLWVESGVILLPAEH